MLLSLCALLHRGRNPLPLTQNDKQKLFRLGNHLLLFHIEHVCDNVRLESFVLSFHSKPNFPNFCSHPFFVFLTRSWFKGRLCCHSRVLWLVFNMTCLLAFSTSLPLCLDLSSLRCLTHLILAILLAKSTRMSFAFWLSLHELRNYAKMKCHSFICQGLVTSLYYKNRDLALSKLAAR